MYNKNKSVFSSQLTTALSKKIVPAMLSVALLSVFMIPNNFGNETPKINAAGCTEQSSSLDNFDSPIQQITNDYNYVGTSFNGWTATTVGGDPQYYIAIHKVNGSSTYYDGPQFAHSGNQYLNLGYSGTIQKKITLTGTGKLSVSAHFAPVDLPPARYSNGFAPWTGQVQILNSSLNTIVSGNPITFNQSSDRNTWVQSSITNYTITTPGDYYINMGVGDSGAVDTINYCLTQDTLGSTAASTVLPITGIVGVSAFPTINMTGSNLPDNTIATFILNGTPTVINGRIIGGNFVPDAGQVIPFNATVGASTGALQSAGVADVNVPTNFTPVPPTTTNDNYTANGTTPIAITPFLGDTGTAIKVTSIGSTIITPGTAQTITVPSGTFSIDTAGAITYVANPLFTGTATVPYIIEDSVGQTATANLIFAPTPAITATNDSYTTVGTDPVTLTPLNGDTAGTIIKSINGVDLTTGTAQVISVTGGNVNVSATGDVNFNANVGFTGNATFSYVIESTNGQTATADQTISVLAPAPTPTLGSTTATIVTPIVGIVGISPFPTIIMTGSNLPDGTAATFQIAAQRAEPNPFLVIAGTIQGGNFVPDAGQIIPDLADIGEAMGVLKSVGATDVQVPTNFTLVPLIATNDNYFTLGSAPVTLTPLVNDTTETTIQSINGVAITPGVAQVIGVTGGNVNVSATGDMQFVAAAGFIGNAVFSYIIADTNGQIAIADQIIVVSAPIAISSSSVIANSSLTVVSTPTNSGGTITIATIQNSTTSSSVSSLSSIISSAQDTDGVSDTTESLAPNDGDANADKIKDNLQSSVASLGDSVTGKYVSVTVDPSSPCQTISDISVNTEAANGKDDLGYDYPVGFVNFISPCAKTIKVKMYWYGLDTTKTYVNRKFKASGSSYDLVSGITSAIETVNGVPVLTYSYSVTDNDILDEDPAVGTIKDPIGPAIVQTMIDNKSINTIRTGGNSIDLIIVLITIMSIGLVSSFLEKSKAN